MNLFSWKNRVRASPVGCALAAAALHVSTWHRTPADALEADCRAARLSSGVVRRWIERSLPKLASRVDLAGDEWTKQFTFSSTCKSIILKPRISDQEKGVVYIPFEDQWARILRDGDWKAFAADYELVLGPSWSPPHSTAFLLLLSVWPTRLFTLLSNMEDAAIINRIAPTTIVVPLMASSWINPDLFQPDQNIQKEFDFLMLANFAEFKRHTMLFDAMRRMRQPRTALLIGVPWLGRDERAVMAEAEKYGVADRVTVRVGLNGVELTREMQKAKVSLILSALEGSNLALVESMFLNIPAAALKSARIGSKAFIESGKTGELLTERRLAQELEDFAERYADYSPRSSVLAGGLDCVTSTQLLNDRIKQQSAHWSRDLVPHYRRFNPTYLNAEDAELLRAEAQSFPARYGFPVGGIPERG